MIASLAATVVLMVACWAAGAWPAIACRPPTALERASVRFGTGVIVLSAVHGAVCLWSTRAAAALVVAIAAIGASVRILRSAPAQSWTDIVQPSERWVLASLAVVAILAGLLPVGAGDSLIYHLPVVRHALAQHQLRFWPDAWRSTFPQAHEMLAVFVGELGGSRFGWIVGFESLAFGGVLLSIGRRMVGPRSWLLPVIVFGGMCPLNLLGDSLKPDVLVLLSTSLGILLLASVDERSPVASAVLIGLAGAGCIGAKYSGIPVAFLLVAALVVETRSLATAALALGIVLPLGGYWYARNIVIHGTPMPPFFAAPFLSPAGNHSVVAAMRGFGRGRTLAAFLSDPVVMFFAPRQFGGTSGLYSPLVFLGACALFIKAQWRTALPAVVAFVVLYVVWFFSLQNPRLLLPAVLPLAIHAAAVIERAHRTGRRLVSRIAITLGFAALVPGLFAVLLGPLRYLRMGEDAYLRTRSPFHDDVQRIERELPPTARVLSLTGVLGSQPARWLSASPYLQAEIAPENLTPQTIAETLRRNGITHVFALEARLHDPPWNVVAERGRILWRNPDACACGQHLLRRDPRVETVLLEVDRGP